jgi:hypothetical protein
MMVFRKPEPNRGKNIQISDGSAISPDWRKQSPRFSLQYTAPGFCVIDCNQEQKAAFASTLVQLGKRTWLDILQSDKHGSGSEKIPRRQMKVTVPAHISEDQEFFTVVRFFGKCPMIGYVHQGVYFIVWLDRSHECY